MFKHHHHSRDKDKDKNSNSHDGSSSSSNSSFMQNPGINNLGNSCFLNSVIQGLAASRPLRDALAAYPGAERALKASHTASKADPNAATASTGQETVPVHVDGADAAGEIDRISAVAQEQSQGHDGRMAPSILTPGTPTTETSPSLQLLQEDPFPDSLPL